MKIFIDGWSCYNIWKNENNSSQLLFDNKFCKGLNKNSIIALNNTSVNHDKQKRRKQVLSFSARPPAKSCIPIFTEKPVAMVTIMQMRWNYTVGHLFPPDIHPESFIKIASLVVEISSESISRPVSYLNRVFVSVYILMYPCVNISIKWYDPLSRFNMVSFVAVKHANPPRWQHVFAFIYICLPPGTIHFWITRTFLLLERIMQWRVHQTVTM
jgi:hypothetical protein